MTADFDVTVNSDHFPAIPADLMETAVRHTVQDAGAGPGEISVTLLGDDAIQEMNRGYLERDRATDVIAFSLGDEERVLGDIYLGHDQAVRQAVDLGIDLGHELVRLTIHGTLHVLGHDHPDGSERTECPMFELQERLLGEVLAGGATR